MKKTLIIKNITREKKKSIIALLSIIMATLLMVCILNVYISFKEMVIKNAYHSYGKYNVLLHNVNDEIVSYIKENYGDNLYGIEKIYGYDIDSMLSFVSCDKNAVEMNNYQLLTGDFPENSNEIAISATAKINGEFVVSSKAVGDEIEVKIDGKTYFYTISGIIDEYDYSTIEEYKTAIVYDDKTTDANNIYIHLDSQKKIDELIENIKDQGGINDSDVFYGDKENGIDAVARIIVNKDLVDIELNRQSGEDNRNTGYLLTAVLGIIVFTAVILIMNVFFSYYGERNKQQAVLVNCGFSKLSIFSIYLIEGIILSVVGCIVGTGVGIFLTKFIFEYIQSVRVNPLENFEVNISGYSLAISAGLCFIATILGIIIPIITYSRKDISKLLMDNEAAQTGKYKKKLSKNFLLTKLLFRDNKNRLREEIFTYISLILIGFIFVSFMFVEKYTSYKLARMEQYDTEFYLVSDDISNMGNFEEIMPYEEYYDIVYDVMAGFKIDEMDFADNMYENIYVLEGLVYCEVVGVSEKQYNRKIELSNEVSYEEFATSGGAILICNYGDTEESILINQQETYYYEGRDEYVSFPSGKLDIYANSRFLDWDSQSDISFIVTDEYFKEHFDYTNVLIKINAVAGYENKLGEWLNKYAPIYGYTLNDNVTEYINAEDSKTMIRASVLMVLIVVTIINSLNILCMNKSKLQKRRNYISTLRILGHSTTNVNIVMLFESLIKGIVSAILSTFLIVVLSKCILPQDILSVIFYDGGMAYLMFNMLWMIAIEFISTVINLLNMRKYHKERLV